MTLKQKDFVVQAGDRAVLWIDPAKVVGHSGTKWPVGKHKLKSWGRVLPKPLVGALRPWVKRNEPFLIPREHFGVVEPVVDTARYRRVSDFIAHKDEVKDSAWYRDLTAELSQHGVARHKEIAMLSEPEILNFLEGYVGRLVDSLATDGFSPVHGGFDSTAVIDQHGQLCKTGSGNHRFNIAKVLGVATFPLRVVAAHEDWLADKPSSAEEVLTHLPDVEAAHR